MTTQADALLREAFDALEPTSDLRSRIGRYLATQQSGVDTSKVAQDLLSVTSGQSGFVVDQAMQRVRNLGKPPKGGG